MARSVASLGLSVGLALVLASGPVSAQSPLMRSGEHARFTRLTLPLSAGQPWQLGRTDDGYGLRLPRGAGEIDTTGIFARIPRSRLGALRAVPDGVDLVLACNECHADAFVEDGLLVIDIRDGRPPTDSRFETQLARPLARSVPTRPVFDWTARFSPDPDRTGAPPAELRPDRPFPPVDEGHARDLLVQQFARAAAQGLIAADTGSAPGIWPLGDPTAAADGLARAQDALRNMRIDAETALDRARRSDSRRGLDRDGSACPPDHLFDVGAWGDDRALARQIAEARGRLLGEFDRPAAEAVTRLARLYVHAGFGAEAITVLSALPVATPELEFLQDLARLVDEATALAGSHLGGHVGCDGPVALWAVLATDDLRSAGVIDRRAVKRAFSALPLHLRRHIGPQLAQRFLAISDPETAQAIRNAIARGQETQDPGLAVLDAGLELARGRPEVASVQVEPVAAGNAPGAPEALAIMVEARRAAGLPIAPDTANDLVALAHEHRGTELGRRLARLEALALAEGGRFDAAFAVRDRLKRSGATADMAEDLALDLIALLAERADDDVMLPRAMAEPVWRDGRLPPAPRLRLAQRLHEAGFPDQALAAFGDADAPAPEAARLMARAALDLGAPGLALRALAGLETQDAARLRGAALLALGDHSSAASAFAAAGLEAEAVQAAWLGEDWGAIALRGEGRERDLAARAQHSGSGQLVVASSQPPDGEEATFPLPWPPAPSEGALAEARDLLEESAGLRSLVTSVLESHPRPAP